MDNTVSQEAIVPNDDFYSQIGIQYEQAFSHNEGLHKIMQKFLQLLPKSAHVLDCGCGTGKPVSQMVAESGRRVSGIDLSQTMVDLSTKQVPGGSFERFNMLEYAPKEPLDGVVAMLSLFELTRQEITSMSHKWFGWLRPGGYLLLGVFGAEECNPTPRMYDADGEFASGMVFTFMKRKVSLGLFTKAGWVALLKQAGFEVTYTETSMFIPPPAAVCDDEWQYFLIAQKKLKV